jgi:membrane-anchored protein YejM (alkaline phosphatase superfamily)
MNRLTDTQMTARNRRNLWIALALVAFIVMIFSTTFLRMQQNAERARDANLARSAAIAASAVPSGAQP